MQINKLLKNKYALLFIAFSTNNHFYSSDTEGEAEEPLVGNEELDKTDEISPVVNEQPDKDNSQVTSEQHPDGNNEDKVHFCCGNLAGLVSAVLTGGFYVLTYIMAQYAKSQIEGIDYSAIATINSQISTQCTDYPTDPFRTDAVINSISGFSIQAQVPIYSSSDYMEYSTTSALWGSIIGIAFIAIGVVIRCIADIWNKHENKIFGYIGLIIQALLWVTMFYMSIISVLWISNGNSSSDITIAPSTVFKPQSFPVFSTAFDVTNGVDTTLSATVNVEAPSGLTFNTTYYDSVYQFPLGYTYPLWILIYGFQNTIDWLNNNPMDSLFDSIKTSQQALVNISSTDSPDFCLIPINMLSYSYNAAGSVYTSDVPADATNSISLGGIAASMMLQAISLILAFLSSIWLMIGNIMQIHKAVKNS